MVDEHEPSRRLARECGAWSRYLVDVEPSLSVVTRYVDAHARGIVEPPGTRCAFDQALVALARRGTFFAQLCDVHARIFRPAGLLRRKLVLTLALLECDRASHGRVDQTNSGSPLSLVLLGGWWSLRFGLLAVSGMIAFFPLRIACAMFGNRGGGA